LVHGLLPCPLISVSGKKAFNVTADARRLKSQF
jgi:hypothetical protein